MGREKGEEKAKLELWRVNSGVVVVSGREEKADTDSLSYRLASLSLPLCGMCGTTLLSTVPLILHSKIILQRRRQRKKNLKV